MEAARKLAAPQLVGVSLAFVASIPPMTTKASDTPGLSPRCPLVPKRAAILELSSVSTPAVGCFGAAICHAQRASERRDHLEVPVEAGVAAPAPDATDVWHTR